MENNISEVQESRTYDLWGGLVGYSILIFCITRVHISRYHYRLLYGTHKHLTHGNNRIRFKLSVPPDSTIKPKPASFYFTYGLKIAISRWANYTFIKSCINWPPTPSRIHACKWWEIPCWGQGPCQVFFFLHYLNKKVYRTFRHICQILHSSFGFGGLFIRITPRRQFPPNQTQTTTVLK